MNMGSWQGHVKKKKSPMFSYLKADPFCTFSLKEIECENLSTCYSLVRSYRLKENSGIKSFSDLHILSINFLICINCCQVCVEMEAEVWPNLSCAYRIGKEK